MIPEEKIRSVIYVKKEKVNGKRSAYVEPCRTIEKRIPAMSRPSDGLTRFYVQSVLFRAGKMTEAAFDHPNRSIQSIGYRWFR